MFFHLFCFIKGFLKQTLSQEIFASFCNKFNPFVPNESFFYHLKTSKKPYGFLMFSGGRESVHWQQMG